MPQFPIVRRAAAGEILTLSKEETHHLKDVLRFNEGELVSLFDPTGGRYRATLLSLAGRAACLRIDEVLPIWEENGRIVLGQAILKGEKMDWAIQKSVELGAREIVPLTTARTIPRESEGKLERWRRIAQEAAKQCGRPHPPVIHLPLPLERALREAAHGAAKIFFWEGATAPMKISEEVFAVIGPEGGFTTQEVEAAGQQGFAIAGLGKAILRAETAAVAAITLIQHELGNI